MISILTSGVALGVHVPGLLLSRRLAEAGVDSTVEVLERCMDAEVRDRIPATKQAFHRSFRVAVAGQKLARDLPFDEAEIERLFDRWAEVEHLVVLSGFWLPIVERYVRDRPAVTVDLCHVDSVRSPSFRHQEPSPRYRDIWLLDAGNQTVPMTIPVSTQPPIAWADRNGRCLAHGGGWGMGTYMERAAELGPLDVVAYGPDDVSDARHDYFMIDPDWFPWLDNGFPPFGRVTAEGAVEFARSSEHHDSFHLARRSVAMVSKPGGGTLMDSLSSATPVVLLEPFGEHEAQNAELWRRLGFGIAFADWQATGCATSVLRELHENLLAARPTVPSYADILAKEAIR